MARLNGYYKVRNKQKLTIMQWTTTNENNTASVSGYWDGPQGYSGNDHDLDFIDEQRLLDSEILNYINKAFDPYKQEK